MRTLRRWAWLVLFFPCSFGCGKGDQPAPQPGGQQPAAPGAPDNEDALKKHFDDLLNAVRNNEQAKADALVSSLVLPNPDNWFAAVFGKDAGARLANDYANNVAKRSGELVSVLRERLRLGQSNLTVQRVGANDAGLSKGQKAAFAAMRQPASLYTVRLVAPGKTAGYRLAYFTHADGAFRFVGQLTALK